MDKKSNNVERYRLLARIGNTDSPYRTDAWREFVTRRHIPVSFLINALESKTPHVSKGAMIMLLMLGDSKGLMAVSKHVCLTFPDDGSIVDDFISAEVREKCKQSGNDRAASIRDRISAKVKELDDAEDDYLVIDELCESDIQSAPGGEHNAGLESSEKAGSHTETDGGSAAGTLPPLYGCEINDMKERIARSIALWHYTSQRGIVIIQGGPQSGKTLLADHITSRLNDGYKLLVGNYRTEKHKKEVMDQSSVLFFDDIDMEFVPNDFIRYCKNGNKTALITVTDSAVLKKHSMFAGSEVYTMPLPTADDLQEYIRSLVFKHFQIGVNTVNAVMHYVNMPGSAVDFITVRRIATALLEDRLLDGVGDEADSCPISTIECNDADIEKACARYLKTVTRRPSQGVSPDMYYRDIEKELGSRVIGQESVIMMIAPVLRVAACDMSDPSRPAGVLFFFGATGCGKTEMARSIADILYKGRIHKVDMSTYSERHSVSRLGGAPPGYVGFNQVPPLFEFVKESGSGVILFDEIEKSHDEVRNYIIDLLDTGFFRDSAGRLYDCRKFIIVMTSNVGFSGIRASAKIGYSHDSEPGMADDRELLRRSGKFLPEFVGRLQVVAKFQPLSEECLREIAGKLYTSMLERMRERGFPALFNGVRVEEIIRAYDPSMGARSMKQYVETIVKQEIIEEFFLKNG